MMTCFKVCSLIIPGIFSPLHTIKLHLRDLAQDLRSASADIFQTEALRILAILLHTQQKETTGF